MLWQKHSASVELSSFHSAGDRAVRESRFDLRDSLVGFELRYKTLGMVGLGSIGLRVAEILPQRV